MLIVAHGTDLNENSAVAAKREAEKIRALGKISIVIYANHAIRAAVTAMREAFAQIRRDGGIHNVDRQIASVEDIFDLQRVGAMKAEEKKYLR